MSERTDSKEFKVTLIERPQLAISRTDKLTIPVEYVENFSEPALQKRESPAPAWIVEACEAWYAGAGQNLVDHLAEYERRARSRPPGSDL